MTDYHKTVRGDFWEPHTELLDYFKICSGWKAYPAISLKAEEFSSRMQYLIDHVAPLLKALKSYVVNPRHILFHAATPSALWKYGHR